jgi:hypothetical protein
VASDDQASAGSRRIDHERVTRVRAGLRQHETDRVAAVPRRRPPPEPAPVGAGTDQDPAERPGR